MGEHRRKVDGRRVFSTEFKRQAVQRILSGEKTVAELSRELDIYPSVIRTWKRFAEAGATTAVQASEDVVPASLRGSGPPRRSLSPDERSGGLGADPRGDQLPRYLRLPAGVGDGQPDLPGGLQPQTHSPGDAAVRLDAGAAGPSPPWAAAPRPDSPAGVEPAVVLRCLRAFLLERRGPLRCLRDRLSRPRGVGLDGLAPPADESVLTQLGRWIE